MSERAALSAGFGALLAWAPAREAPVNAVIIVDFISPPRIEQSTATPAVPAKPKPVARRMPWPPEFLPVLSAPAKAPASDSTPAPLPMPAPAPIPVGAVAPPEPAAAPVTPAVFNADYLDDKKYWLWSDIRIADARNPAGVDFYSQPGRNVAARFEYSF